MKLSTIRFQGKIGIAGLLLASVTLVIAVSYGISRLAASVMHWSILSGIVAFLAWWTTDTSLKPEHARTSKGRIMSAWGILFLVLVQMLLWALTGFFASWMPPRLPRFLVTGWRLPIISFASEFCQWFALLMVLQYAWTIGSTTLKTAVIGMMAAFGSPWAKQTLYAGFWQAMEMDRKLGYRPKHPTEEISLKF